MAVAKYTGPTLIGDIAIDCTVTETHTGAATVTEHPVEDGVNITDHIRPEPLQLALSGIITNTPIGTKQIERVINAGGAPVRTIQNDTPTSEAGFAQTAWQKLEAIRLAGKPIKVVTRDRTYESMAMMSLTVPKDAKTGNALAFTAQFKQVRVVFNRTTRTVVAKQPKAQKKQDTGKQPTKEQTPEKLRSVFSGKIFGDDGTTAAQEVVRGTFQSLGVQ